MATLDEFVVGAADVAVHAMFRRRAGRPAVVSRRGLRGRLGGAARVTVVSAPAGEREDGAAALLDR